MHGRKKLSTKAIENLKRVGLFGDGDGLYIQVTASTRRKNARNKSWVFRYSRDHKTREMGLGAFPIVSLAEAREKVVALRKMLLDGKDPLHEREKERLAAKANDSRRISFAECATKYIEAHRAGWKNKKHHLQWTATIETYANPTIGNLAVADVNVGHLVRVLEPIWDKKHETATRLRARIENILDWSIVRGYRGGPNPAAWKANLKKLLPNISKKARVKHHTALPYERIGDFMRELRKIEGTAARALEFTILCAARTGEVIGATPDEIDAAKALWTIPAKRMKSGNEHRVPLVPRAIEIVRACQGGPFVFAGEKEGEPLSNMAMLMLLQKQMGLDVTTHGFRSSFRDWAGDKTAIAREVVEHALAHTIGDQSEQAYRRGDALERRRKLMDAWATYCDLPSERKATVTAISAA